jgi:hypothetical protein
MRRHFSSASHRDNSCKWLKFQLTVTLTLFTERECCALASYIPRLKLGSRINVQRFPFTEFVSPFLDSNLCLLSPTPRDVSLVQNNPCIRLFYEKNLFYTSCCDTNKLLHKPSITTFTTALVFKRTTCYGGKGPSTIKLLRDFLICIATYNMC